MEQKVVVRVYMERLDDIKVLLGGVDERISIIHKTELYPYLNSHCSSTRKLYVLICMECVPLFQEIQSMGLPPIRELELDVYGFVPQPLLQTLFRQLVELPVTQVNFAEQRSEPLLVIDELVNLHSLNQMVIFNGCLSDPGLCEQFIRQLPRFNGLKTFILNTRHSIEIRQIVHDIIPKCIRLESVHVNCPDYQKLNQRVAFNQSLPVKQVLILLSVIHVPRFRKGGHFPLKDHLRLLFTYL